MRIFGLELKFNGFDIWHSGNFTPGSKANVQHSATHKHVGGTDPIAPIDIGAEPAFTKKTGFNKAFGTTSGTVTQGNDSRLSNARTPLAHTHVISNITNMPTALSQFTNDIGAGGGVKITTNTTAPGSPSPGDFWYKVI